MHDPSDIELDKSRDILSSYTPEPGRSARAGIVLALVAAAAAAGAYLYFGRRPQPESSVAKPSAPSAAVESARPLGAEPEPIEVPPLAETDPLVRKLVSALSSHPRIAAWLATDDLIRTFVVVVENIANEITPASHLTVLRPSSPFRVVTRNGVPFMDPASYQRYSEIADAVASIDAGGAARLYATFKPRFEEAYGELGRSDGFDHAFERATAVMLQTPVVDGEIALVQGPVGYRFNNPALERLSPPQKQLLRMGPRNEQVIQSKLRDIAQALGVPPERLAR